MQLSGRWHVKLGEGGRRMTDSQVTAAAARCWIDAETPVRRPQSSEWTKLGDVAPAKRITEERITDDRGDTETSAMILVSGEFEVVDDPSSPTKDELAAARPRRLSPTLFALAVAMLAGGALLARRHVPIVSDELDAIAAAVRPAPTPTPTPAPAPAPAPRTPLATTAIASATLAIVPKMHAPAPKMREPSAPPAKTMKAMKAAKTAAPKKAATRAKVAPKRATGRR
jgi:hypothetical protein